MLIRFQIWLVIVGSLLLTNSAHAFSVYRLGGEEGNSWKMGISSEPGEYLILDVDGQVVGRGTLTMPTTYDSWEDTLVEVVVDSLGGEWLRPFYVDPMLNLAQDGVRERVPRGHFDNLALSGFCAGQGAALKLVRPMFDGNPNTAIFFAVTSSEDSEERQWVFVQNIIVDLGADFPIERIRFFLRLGQSNPHLDNLLDEMSPPRLRREDLAKEDFSDNRLRGYEVAGAASVQHFPAVCTYASDWFQRILPGPQARNDSRLTLLQRNEENLDPVVDIRFPTQPLQWVAIRPLYPMRSWEVAEFQVFGRGYVPRAVYTSAVLDMGEEMVWGKIRWQGVRDEEATLLVQTRSGVDPDPDRYWLKTTVPGEFKEITRQEYERASPGCWNKRLPSSAPGDSAWPPGRDRPRCCGAAGEVDWCGNSREETRDGGLTRGRMAACHAAFCRSRCATECCVSPSANTRKDAGRWWNSSRRKSATRRGCSTG